MTHEPKEAFFIVLSYFSITILSVNLFIYPTSKIDLYRPMLDEIVVTLEEDRARFNAIKKVQDSIRNDSLKKARLIEKRKRDSLGTKLEPKLEKTELKKKVNLKKVLDQ